MQALQFLAFGRTCRKRKKENNFQSVCKFNVQKPQHVTSREEIYQVLKKRNER